MRAMRVIAVAGVTAALLVYGGFSVLAAESKTTGNGTDAATAMRGGIPKALVLAYLAGKTGQTPADLYQAIQKDGLEAVLERSGVDGPQLRTTLQQIRDLHRELHGPGHRRHHGRLHQLFVRALAELSGKTTSEIRQMHQQLGDWHKVMEALQLDPADVRAKVRELIRERKGEAGARDQQGEQSHQEEPGAQGAQEEPGARVEAGVS